VFGVVILRVYGIDGLCVADVSIMPGVTSGTADAPTIMIGEKTAEMIKTAQVNASSVTVGE
jgi:choline dehydrogenase